jgi:hypothetical protein
VATRKRLFGEVFTPELLVKQTVDTYIPEVLYDPHLTVLEPAVGDGRFLIYILHQRLSQSQDSYHTLQSVSTLYGIDIQKDNVIKTRERLFNVIKVRNPDILESPKMKDVLHLIISENIIHGCAVSKKYIDTQQPITINKYNIIALNPIRIEVTVYNLVDVVNYQYDNLLFIGPLPIKRYVLD